MSESIYSNKKRTTTEFIIKANSVHNSKYEYSKSFYITAKLPIIITCKIHGNFQQIAGEHLRGRGCKLCHPTKKNTDSFIQRSRLIHGNKYNYDKSKYTVCTTKVIITCPIHGDFKQTPDGHWHGNGCPKCVTRGYYSQPEVRKTRENKNTILYLILIRSNFESFFKIGITQESIAKRSIKWRHNKLSISCLFQLNGALNKLYDLEQYIIEKFSHYRYIPSCISGGRTECFKELALLDICEFLDDWREENYSSVSSEIPVLVPRIKSDINDGIAASKPTTSKLYGS
jgi:hypothetical protein